MRARISFLLAVFVEDALDRFGRELAIDFVADHHDGREAAGADAAAAVDREQPVLGAFAARDAELFFDLGKDLIRSFHIACSSQAHADAVLALGLERELRVERDHAVHLGKGDPEAFRDRLLDAHGQKSVNALCLLQDVHEAARRALGLLDDRL